MQASKINEMNFFCIILIYIFLVIALSLALIIYPVSLSKDINNGKY